MLLQTLVQLSFRPRGFPSVLLVWILLVLNLFSIGVKAVKPISSISWRSKDRVRHSLRWERFCRILVTMKRSESWARSRKEHRNLKSYFDFSPALPFFLFSKLNFCAWLSEHICYPKTLSKVVKYRPVAKNYNSMPFAVVFFSLKKRIKRHQTDGRTKMKNWSEIGTIISTSLSHPISKTNFLTKMTDKSW